MRTILVTSSLGVLALLLASYASAATITYVATLNGATEVPAVITPATGFATLTLNGDTLSVVESYSGLIGGPATGAHIHCCTPPGSNTIIAVPFNSFPTTTSGTYSATFNLLDPSVYTQGATGFLTLNGGGTAAGAEAALIAGLNAGQAYVNIHDAANPGGEIRGLVAVAPEPGTFWLAGGLLAFAAFATTRARSKKRSY